LGINIYVLLEQWHQCLVIVLTWQDISCRSLKYRVWICDEEKFFIPLSFLLHLGFNFHASKSF
jgi:hypothetical protein